MYIIMAILGFSLLIIVHELGHFIDQVQNIYPPIKSILWANKDKVDCQRKGNSIFIKVISYRWICKNAW